MPARNAPPVVDLLAMQPGDIILSRSVSSDRKLIFAQRVLHPTRDLLRARREFCTHASVYLGHGLLVEAVRDGIALRALSLKADDFFHDAPAALSPDAAPPKLRVNYRPQADGYEYFRVVRLKQDAAALGRGIAQTALDLWGGDYASVKEFLKFLPLHPATGKISGGAKEQGEMFCSQLVCHAYHANGARLHAGNLAKSPMSLRPDHCRQLGWPHTTPVATQYPLPELAQTEVGFYLISRAALIHALPMRKTLFSIHALLTPGGQPLTSERHTHASEIAGQIDALDQHWAALHLPLEQKLQRLAGMLATAGA
ncbi:hypothetical protein [Chromobacterium subtsugae]|uniref:hypothetical protein n=1 Tax=Chromobacterium subtsugae TaxID=251747 RepID=UPI0006412135|nr:hypothetical protein [Chromobacterium subtsugae]